MKIEENEIESLDKLKELSKLELKKINLLGNPVCKDDGKYREEVFAIFPQLTSCDDRNKDGDEVDSTSYAGEEGDFEGEEFDEEDLEGEEFEEGEDGPEGDEEEDVEDEEGEGDEEDEESSKNKKKKE